jgi:hypothetical protein
MIPAPQLLSLTETVMSLVERYGHPDDIPLGSLVLEGVDPFIAEQCEILLVESEYSGDSEAAVAKWLQQIEELVG